MDYCICIENIKTLGLSLVQKKVGRGNSLDFSDTDLCINIHEMERAFVQHFDDRSIQVDKVFNIG